MAFLGSHGAVCDRRWKTDILTHGLAKRGPKEMADIDNRGYNSRNAVCVSSFMLRLCLSIPGSKCGPWAIGEATSEFGSMQFGK